MSLRIDGKKISSDIKEELKEQVKQLKRKHALILELNHRHMNFQKKQHRKNCLP